MLPGGHLRALSVSAGFASLVGLCGTDLGVLPAGSSSPARLWLYSCASCVINCGCACVAQRRVNQKQFSVGWAFCPSHEPHPIYVRGRPASLSGKAHPKVVLLSHGFNDYEPVVAVDQFLGYLNVPGRRYLLREGYSLESAKDGWERTLWKLMDGEVEKGVLLRATKEDLKESDFVIQFSAPDNLKPNFPNLWPLYVFQD